MSLHVLRNPYETQERANFEGLSQRFDNITTGSHLGKETSLEFIYLDSHKVVGKNEPTIFFLPNGGEFDGDLPIYHGRIRKKSPTQQTKVY